MSTKKTIVITGVSSGLGKALFDMLKDKVRIIAVSRTFLPEQQTVANENLVLIPCDLSQREDVSRLLAKLAESLRGEHEIIFINNAAVIAPIGAVGALDDTTIHAAAETNFISPMRITNALCAVPNLGNLSLIHIGTGAARTPIMGWALYCATKAACKMFFDVLQEQYKNDGRVSVHQFDPGVIDSPMQGQIREASAKDFPRVGEFVALKHDKKLSDPALVAKRLVEQYIRI